MEYIIDGIIIAIIVLFTYQGKRKGFIKSITEFLGAIVSALLASYFGKIISTMIYENFIEQGIYDKIYKSLEDFNTDQAISKFLNDLPSLIVAMLNNAGITEESLISSSNGTNEVIAKSVLSAISPAFILFIQLFVMIILFILFIIIIKALASILTKICSLPVLAQINGGLGAIFGFLFSLVIVWVLVAVVHFVVVNIDSEITQNIKVMFDSSIITNFLMNFNPFDFLLKIH